MFKQLGIFFTIIFAIAWFGFVGPGMISSNSTELVIGWIIITMAIVWVAVALLYKHLNKKEESNEN